MVSSIVPGATSANAFGLDSRFSRTSAERGAEGQSQNAISDRVEVSAAALAASRDSVREALNQLHETLSLGHEAQATLLKVQELARTDASQAELSDTLAAYAQRLDAAVADGARLAAGESVTVQAEPGAAPVVIAGVDLRLGEGVISLASDQRVDDPALPQLTQRSLDALQGEVGRLLESTRALEAHQGFLGAAANASARGDFDADTARLIALQVRQGLDAAGATSIANFEPQAVLSLFRV